MNGAGHALKQALAELGWLSAGKNLLDFGQVDSSKSSSGSGSGSGRSIVVV